MEFTVGDKIIVVDAENLNRELGLKEGDVGIIVDTSLPFNLFGVEIYGFGGKEMFALEDWEFEKYGAEPIGVDEHYEDGEYIVVDTEHNHFELGEIVTKVVSNIDDEDFEFKEYINGEGIIQNLMDHQVERLEDEVEESVVDSEIKEYAEFLGEIREELMKVGFTSEESASIIVAIGGGIITLE